MSMKPKFTQKKAGLLALALLAAMTAPATVHGATPVSAAPASQSSGGYPHLCSRQPVSGRPPRFRR